MIDEICRNFAKRVKEVRKAKGLSKVRLSELVGCDLSYIGKIERGEKFPNLKMIAKLAIALDVSVKELFE